MNFESESQSVFISGPLYDAFHDGFGLAMMHFTRPWLVANSSWLGRPNWYDAADAVWHTGDCAMLVNSVGSPEDVILYSKFKGCSNTCLLLLRQVKNYKRPEAYSERGYYRDGSYDYPGVNEHPLCNQASGVHEPGAANVPFPIMTKAYDDVVRIIQVARYHAVVVIFNEKDNMDGMKVRGCPVYIK